MRPDDLLHASDDASIPRCLQCGYELRVADEGRCPECGHGYDHRSLRLIALAQMTAVRAARDRIVALAVVTLLAAVVTGARTASLWVALTLLALCALTATVGLSRFLWRRGLLNTPFEILTQTGFVAVAASLIAVALVGWLVAAAVSVFALALAWLAIYDTPHIAPHATDSLEAAERRCVGRDRLLIWLALGFAHVAVAFTLLG